MESAILERFRSERELALAADDPMASLLALATVSPEGRPQVRTLVLRDVESKLAIFLNRTSPKWRALQSTPEPSFMTYWPSRQLQYRFDCRFDPMDKSLVDRSWLLRPETPKRVDHLYESWQAQSAPVDGRAELLAQTERLDPKVLNSPTSEAVGLFLVPTVIERLDLKQQGGPHDRRRYRAANDWQEEVLMP